MKKKKVDKRLPALIKAAMFENGISRDEMAVYLHVSVSTYNRRMNHYPEEFTVNNLRVFKDKLKLDPHALAEAML